MELTNEKVINAPRARVYDALHDAEILRQAIPGCQALTKVAPDQYDMIVALKVGPIRTTFSGSITLYNEDEPAGFSLRGQGDGSDGSAEGHAHVALAAIDPGTTNLAYHVSADLDGEVGALEEAVVETAARTMAAEFFLRLTLLLEGDGPVHEGTAPINTAMNVPANVPATPPLPPQDFLRDSTAPSEASATVRTVQDVIATAPDHGDEAEPTAADVITVGGSRTDDLGVYRDTVPGARGGFDADPHYTSQASTSAQHASTFEPTPASGLTGSYTPVGHSTSKGQAFGHYNQGAIAQDQEGSPLRFMWRLFLIAVGIIIIYLLLTDGI